MRIGMGEGEDLSEPLTMVGSHGVSPSRREFRASSPWRGAKDPDVPK